RVREVGERARAIARELPTRRSPEASTGGVPLALAERPARCPSAASFDARRGSRGKETVRARGLRELAFGEGTLDLGALEQLVDESQVRAIGALLRRLGRLADGRTPLRVLVGRALAEVDARGLYHLDPRPELARVRALDLGAAVNRLRSLEITRN
ncbi:MAG: isopentenyl-diphosphate delta-isomerase, partial [Myxococcales bacterium]|nr:isopentenyl-diphosphate delta-isomerase [Myxococcales bacterium]